MKLGLALVVLASAVVALCGCDQTESVIMPLPFDKVVTRLQIAVTNQPSCFPEWNNRKITFLKTQCSLTMSRGWNMSSTKMIDNAEVVFTPNSQTQTVVTITVFARNAFAMFDNPERNPTSEPKKSS
jgi:hypothetical protein